MSRPKCPYCGKDCLVSKIIPWISGAVNAWVCWSCAAYGRSDKDGVLLESIQKRGLFRLKLKMLFSFDEAELEEISLSQFKKGFHFLNEEECKQLTLYLSGAEDV